MDKPKPTPFKRATHPIPAKKPNKNSRPREKRPARPAQPIHWKATVGPDEMIVTAVLEIDAVKQVYAKYGVTPDSIEKAKLITFVVTTGDDVEHEIRAANHEHAKKVFFDHRSDYAGQPVLVEKRPYKAPEHLMDRPFRHLNELLKGAK